MRSPRKRKGRKKVPVYAVAVLAVEWPEMMDKAVYYAAVAANVLMLGVSAYLATQVYGRDILSVVLLAVPPALSLCALYLGPDIEERRLSRQVRKTRLRRELEGAGKE